MTTAAITDRFSGQEDEQMQPLNSVDMPVSITPNENRHLCAACGGACCRTRPGIEAPERFLADHDPAELLSRMLASGTWVLDRHLGLPQTPATAGMANRMELVTWYPRPATRQERRRRTMAGLPETGECVFLERDGCTLSFHERPLLCRSLEPGSEECHSSWSRADAALAWWPLQHVVLQAIAGCRRRNPDLEWPAERPAQL